MDLRIVDCPKKLQTIFKKLKKLKKAEIIIKCITQTCKNSSIDGRQLLNKRI